MNPCESTERAEAVKRTIADHAGDGCERRGRMGNHPGRYKRNEFSDTDNVKQTNR
jgi:hypothetical protein